MAALSAQPESERVFCLGFLWVRPTRRVFLPVFTVGLDERRSEHERQSAGCAGGEHRCTRAVHVSEGSAQAVHTPSGEQQQAGSTTPAGRATSQPGTHAGRQAGRDSASRRNILEAPKCPVTVPRPSASREATSRRLPQDVSTPCQSLPTSSRGFRASGVSCLAHGAPACFPVPPGVTLCDPLWHSPLVNPSSPAMHARATAA